MCPYRRTLIPSKTVIFVAKRSTVLSTVFSMITSLSGVWPLKEVTREGGSTAVLLKLVTFENPSYFLVESNCLDIGLVVYQRRLISSCVFRLIVGNIV